MLVNRTTLVLTTALLFSAACGDDTEVGTDAGLDSSVDAGPPTFSADVLPLLQGTCTGCHGGSGGFTIGNGESSLVNTPATASSGCSEMATNRVTPGNAEASVLFLRLDGRCEELMPRGATSPRTDIRDAVRDWINQGANF